MKIPRFKNELIKNKLILIIMVACIVALSISGFALIVMDQNVVRNLVARNISILAEIISDNCKANLALGDLKGTKEVLMTLDAESSIISGCVLVKNKEVASYYRNGDNNFSHSPRW